METPVLPPALWGPAGHMAAASYLFLTVLLSPCARVPAALGRGLCWAVPFPHPLPTDTDTASWKPALRRQHTLPPVLPAAHLSPQIIKCFFLPLFCT